MAKRPYRSIFIPIYNQNTPYIIKQFLSVFFALSLIALVGCESDNGASSLDFEGEWAYVGEYDNEDGWDYYPEESNFYAAITDNTVDIYGAWDDYYFQNGYYPSFGFYFNSSTHTKTTKGNPRRTSLCLF